MCKYPNNQLLTIRMKSGALLCEQQRYKDTVRSPWPPFRPTWYNVRIFLRAPLPNKMYPLWPGLSWLPAHSFQTRWLLWCFDRTETLKCIAEELPTGSLSSAECTHSCKSIKFCLEVPLLLLPILFSFQHQAKNVSRISNSNFLFASSLEANCFHSWVTTYWQAWISALDTLTYYNLCWGLCK